MLLCGVSGGFAAVFGTPLAAAVFALEFVRRAELGRFVLEWTYNPLITFGMTAAPTESLGTLNVGFRKALIEPLLKRLASRVVYLEYGRVVADLPTHDFFNGPLPAAAEHFLKGELG